MKTYEYKIITFCTEEHEEEMEAQLTGWGDQGWELVSMFTTVNINAVLKKGHVHIQIP